jgi:hypothetical protein
MQLDSIRQALVAVHHLMMMMMMMITSTTVHHQSQAFAQLLQSQIMRVFVEGYQCEVTTTITIITIASSNCYRAIGGIQLHIRWK